MRGASRAMREPPCATVGTPDILPDSVAVAIQPPRRSSVHARSRYTSGLAIPRTRPFDPASLAAYALPQIRPPLGTGAVVWRYTVLVPFQEVRAAEAPTVLVTDDDIDRIAETLCNHFGGVTILPPLKGWGLRDPADSTTIEFNMNVPHVVY